MVYYWRHHALLVVQVSVLNFHNHTMVRPVDPLLHMLQCRGYWAGVNSVRFLENFHEHAAELGQTFLNLIDIFIWEFTTRSMKYGTLWFTIGMHKD